MKAQQSAKGRPVLFRPDQNAARMQAGHESTAHFQGPPGAALARQARCMHPGCIGTTVCHEHPMLCFAARQARARKHVCEKPGAVMLTESRSLSDSEYKGTPQ
eukprot:1159948-Pelagomonas_calceolata.AAC.5